VYLRGRAGVFQIACQLFVVVEIPSSGLGVGSGKLFEPLTDMPRLGPHKMPIMCVSVPNIPVHVFCKLSDFVHTKSVDTFEFEL
jgi:hypothetical protein